MLDMFGNFNVCGGLTRLFLYSDPVWRPYGINPRSADKPRNQVKEQAIYIIKQVQFWPPKNITITSQTIVKNRIKYTHLPYIIHDYAY